MVAIYVSLIQSGIKTLDDVPKVIRQQVQEALNGK